MLPDYLTDLKQKSYRFYLSALLCPPAARGQLSALWLLHAELALIPARVSEPMMGIVRATWWRDEILKIHSGKMAEHKLLQNLAPYHFNFPLLADFAETFDAPFVAEEVRAVRLQQRAEFLAALAAEILRAPAPLCFAAYRAAQDSQFYAAYQAAFRAAPKALRRAVRPLALLAEITHCERIKPISTARMAWLAALLALGK